MVSEKINNTEIKNKSFKKLDIFRELGNVIILVLIVIIMLIVTG